MWSEKVPTILILYRCARIMTDDSALRQFPESDRIRRSYPRQPRKVSFIRIGDGENYGELLLNVYRTTYLECLVLLTETPSFFPSEVRVKR